ncbi:FxsA family protein [Aliikangiella maris]|uniref:FxsA family protein n=2 Tax=Aliikangiella maris TaxID=3162458 RepID=A0ABV2BZD4_9GAMM
MKILLIVFIIVPIIEIGVFIQVGDLLGLAPTLIIILFTAVLGVHLLKQQGLKTWFEIQNKLTQGQIPAQEMASAAQLLFAGGLLLTPGFVTDAIGFLLMIPMVRIAVSHYLYNRWSQRIVSGESHQAHFSTQYTVFTKQTPSHTSKKSNIQESSSNRTIEGEFEEKKSDSTD